MQCIRVCETSDLCEISSSRETEGEGEEEEEAEVTHSGLSNNEM